VLDESGVAVERSDAGHGDRCHGTTRHEPSDSVAVVEYRIAVFDARPEPDQGSPPERNRLSCLEIEQNASAGQQTETSQFPRPASPVSVTHLDRNLAQRAFAGLQDEPHRQDIHIQWWRQPSQLERELSSVRPLVAHQVSATWP